MGGTYGSYAVTRAPANAMAVADGTDRAVLEGALGARVESTLVELAGRAEQPLAAHRQDVLALAHALETHRTLSGEDVIAVMQRTRGPIVDGTEYVDPAYLELIERYHSDALKALEGRPQVLLLPPLRGLVDVEPDSSAAMEPYRASDGDGAHPHPREH